MKTGTQNTTPNLIQKKHKFDCGFSIHDDGLCHCGGNIEVASGNMVPYKTRCSNGHISGVNEFYQK